MPQNNTAEVQQLREALKTAMMYMPHGERYGRPLRPSLEDDAAFDQCYAALGGDPASPMPPPDPSPPAEVQRLKRQMAEAVYRLAWSSEKWRKEASALPKDSAFVDLFTTRSRTYRRAAEQTVAFLDISYVFAAGGFDAALWQEVSETMEREYNGEVME
jgi:hypothetical protein